MEVDRKTLIADAAVAVLGAAGSRGLTHRAVDAQAGLPAGSTSFYCRTRLDLLRLALQRHAALDLADLAADAQRLSHPQWSSEDLVQLLVARVNDWLSDAKRARLVARFELFLLASREPELATIVEQQRRHFLQATITALQRAGVADAEDRALALVVMVDGLLLDQLRLGRASELDARHIEALRRAASPD